MRKAFDYYSEAACGLIVTTATEISSDFLSELNDFGTKTGKPVGLLYGKELARYILKYI